jgi:hypothetical protein
MRVIEPFYCLDNFRLMLETLQRRDGDLLTPEELNFIREFFRRYCEMRTPYVAARFWSSTTVLVAR